MNETAKVQLIADKATLQADKAALVADKATLEEDKAELKTTVAKKDTEISGLRTAKEKAEKDAAAKTATNRVNELRIEDQEANLEEAKEEKMPTWAIAILGVVVSREQQGKPVFVPKKSAAVLAAG